MIITLTLNPSIDYILQVPEIHMEDTLRAKYAFFQSGGKGINVSRVLTRLGVENTAWGFCGGDTGRWLESFLDEEQVPHEFIHTQADTRINPIITDMHDKKQLRVSAAGEAIHHHEAESLLQRFQSLSPEVKGVVLGGSVPPGMESDVFGKLIAYAHRQGIPCILDADGDSLKQGLAGKPWLIKPNQYELSRLLGQEVSDPAEVIAGARAIIVQYGIEIVVVSLGEAGAFLITENQVFNGKAPEVSVQSKVGAGDSMVAGLVKGCQENVGLAQMLRMGIAAGTATVMTASSELCHRDDYETLLNQVIIVPYNITSRV